LGEIEIFAIFSYLSPYFYTDNVKISLKRTDLGIPLFGKFIPSLTYRAMLVCKVVEVWQDFLSEYVDKKFTYICYRRLIRHE